MTFYVCEHGQPCWAFVSWLRGQVLTRIVAFVCSRVVRVSGSLRQWLARQGREHLGGPCQDCQRQTCQKSWFVAPLRPLWLPCSAGFQFGSFSLGPPQSRPSKETGSLLLIKLLPKVLPHMASAQRHEANASVEVQYRTCWSLGDQLWARSRIQDPPLS